MNTLGRTRILVASPSEIILQSIRFAVRAFVVGQDLFEFPDENALQVAGREGIATFLGNLPIEVVARTACIVDLSSEPTPQWRLLHDNHTLRPTWLSAQFPEVYWIFIVRDGGVPIMLPQDARTQHFVPLDDLPSIYGILKRHSDGFRSWFDPCGLRAAALLSDKVDARCLDACTQGLVFDDELSFAIFNSYALYRSGIPTRMIATAAEFRTVKNLGKIGRRYVLLEDVELNYPDAAEAESDRVFMPDPKPAKVRESLDQRLKLWGLEGSGAVAARVIVSSSRVAGYDLVIKPFGGLYDRRIVSYLPDVTSVRIRNDDQVSSSEATNRAPRHSAPGVHQAIATALLTRVRALQGSVDDPVSSVHAALLALEAEGLLGYQTYAMAVEALTARHALEAVAESSFSGAADDLEVADRIRDLKHSMLRVVFHEVRGRKILATHLSLANGWLEMTKLHKRCVQLVNGMLECTGQLREIYRRFNKLDEEEAALREIRWCRLGAFILRRSFTEGLGRCLPHYGRKGVASFVHRISAVLEFFFRALLGGVPSCYVNVILNPFNLGGVILGWILFFAWRFESLAATGGLKGACDLGAWDWFRHSAVTFLALQQGIIGDPKFRDISVPTLEGFSAFWTLTATEMALGYLHLAVLVAVLIHKFTRR